MLAIIYSECIFLFPNVIFLVVYSILFVRLVLSLFFIGGFS